MMENSYQRHLNRKNTISESCPVDAGISSSLSSRSTLNNVRPNTTRPFSNTNSPRILPGLAFSLELILILSCIGIADLVQSLESPVSIATSLTHGCRGYNYRQFTIVDRICNDCYDVYRDPNLYGLCRQDCFTSSYYKDCLVVLRTTNARIEQLKQHIRDLNGVIFLEEISEKNSSSGKVEEELPNIEEMAEALWNRIPARFRGIMRLSCREAVLYELDY